MKPKIFLVAAAVLSLLVQPFSAAAATADAKPGCYLIENEIRYAAYIDEYPDLPVETAIAYVNANADKNYYSDVTVVPDPASTLVLCSKNYALPADYVPSELVSIDGWHQMRSDAAEHFLRMSADASREGLTFAVYSAYRSYSSQSTVYASYLKNGTQSSVDSFSARPGHSEHQTGLAVDILHKYGSSGFRSAKFQKTDEFAWLRQNAYKYGFILRYPEGFTNITGYTFEPWHWRYVGVHTATVMHNESIPTYEEFYGKYLAADPPELSPDCASPYNFAVISGDNITALESYDIDGRYYFKLRDIAFLLSGTEYEFDVVWENDEAAIELVSEKPYSGAAEYEIQRYGSPKRFFKGSRVNLDGAPSGIPVHNIAGSSYAGLYDLCTVLNIPLKWDGHADTVIIGGTS